MTEHNLSTDPSSVDSSAPYRTLALVQPLLTVTPYVHPPRTVGEGTVAQTCKTPGWWARFFMRVDRGTVWKCGKCGGKWELEFEWYGFKKKWEWRKV